MKTVLCISLLTLVSMQALGGSEKVDSLKQLLEQHTTTDKAEVLWGIAYELFDVDNAQALFYAERAYHDVWKRGDSLQIVKVGTTYRQLLRSPDARVPEFGLQRNLLSLKAKFL